MVGLKAPGAWIRLMVDRLMVEENQQEAVRGFNLEDQSPRLSSDTPHL